MEKDYIKTPYKYSKLDTKSKKLELLNFIFYKLFKLFYFVTIFFK